MPEQPTFLICPYCQKHHDLKKLRDNGHEVRPTDCSLCTHCAEVSIIGTDLKPRKMEYEDWMLLHEKGLFNRIDRAQQSIKIKLLKNPPTENETSVTEVPL